MVFVILCSKDIIGILSVNDQIYYVIVYKSLKQELYSYPVYIVMGPLILQCDLQFKWKLPWKRWFCILNIYLCLLAIKLAARYDINEQFF